MQKFLTGRKDKFLEIILLFKQKALTYSLGILYVLGLMPIPAQAQHSEHLGKGEADGP